MKIIFYDSGIQFEINEGINFLVIEAPEIFERSVVGLHSSFVGISEDVVIDDGEKVDLGKICDMIFTPFDLSFDKKDIQRKLYNTLSMIAETDFGGEYAEVQSAVLRLIDSLVQSSDYDVKIGDFPDIKSYFKLFDISIRNPEGSFASKLIEYIVTVHELTGKRIFLLINCEAYIDDASYAHISKTARYYNLFIVFVARHQIDLIKGENIYIIDSDLCEIH